MARRIFTRHRTRFSRAIVSFSVPHTHSTRIQSPSNLFADFIRLMLLKESPAIAFDYHRQAQNVLIDIFVFALLSRLSRSRSHFSTPRTFIPSGCPSDDVFVRYFDSSSLLLFFIFIIIRNYF